MGSMKFKLNQSNEEQEPRSEPTKYNSRNRNPGLLQRVEDFLETTDDWPLLHRVLFAGTVIFVPFVTFVTILRAIVGR